MKKRIIIIISIILLAIRPVVGQIIYTDEYAGIHPRAEKDAPSGLEVPIQNISADQWMFQLTPTGDGLLLLLGLGGGYLLKKTGDKRKKTEGKR